MTVFSSLFPFLLCIGDPVVFILFLISTQWETTDKRSSYDLQLPYDSLTVAVE